MRRKGRSGGAVLDAVIDCGLFRVFSDEERLLYVEKLSFVLVPGTRE